MTKLTPTNSTVRLLIFTRYPAPGTTKTRLIPALGPLGSALLQKKMTEKIISEATKLYQQSNIPSDIFFSGGNEVQMKTWLGPHHYIKQGKGDLGQKMGEAFRHGFEENGAHGILLVGSDLPELSFKILQNAINLLQRDRVVLGPTFDGGYYLIGFMKENSDTLCPQIFYNMPWSTDKVFEETVRRVKSVGLSIVSLPTLHDIDTPADLHLCRKQGLL